MENASKALIIAAGVLIGVLILSLIAYLVTSFGVFSRQMNDKMEKTEISQFNSRFYKFEGRKDISAQDVVTIINYARQNNIRYQTENDSTTARYISVYIGDRKMENANDLDKFLKDSYEKTFSCEKKSGNEPIVINDDSGLVKKIIFYEN